MKKMMRTVMVALFASSLLTGCVVAPSPPYYGEEVAPPLPSVVVLGDEPYYQYGGYHYRYQNERWHYSREVNGQWRELPKSHWPKEIRHRSGEDRGGERGHELEHERR